MHSEHSGESRLLLGVVEAWHSTYLLALHVAKARLELAALNDADASKACAARAAHKRHQAEPQAFATSEEPAMTAMEGRQVGWQA